MPARVLHVVVERVADVPAEAARLIAAEGRAGIEAVIRVDPDRAGLDLPRQAMRQLHILRPDRRYEPVDGAVGDLHGLLSVAKADGRQHRAEDFFLRDL